MQAQRQSAADQKLQRRRQVNRIAVRRRTVETGQYGLDSCDHHLSGDRAAPKGAATVYEGEGGRGRRRWMTAGASEAEMGGCRA